MEFDETHWPIVRLTMGDTFTQVEVDRYIQLWELALSRNETFGLVVVQASDKTSRPDKDSTAHYMNWLKQNKDRIGAQCAGMGLVFPSAKLLLMYKPLTAISTRKMYGCPGKAFASEPEATEWLNGLLHA